MRTEEACLVLWRMRHVVCVPCPAISRSASRLQSVLCALSTIGYPIAGSVTSKTKGESALLRSQQGTPAAEHPANMEWFVSLGKPSRDVLFAPGTPAASPVFT